MSDHVVHAIAENGDLPRTDMTNIIHIEQNSARPIWQNMTILRRKDVELITGLSRSSIYAGIQNGTFPAPIHLSVKSVGWVSNEIDAWIQQKMAQRT